MVVQVPYMPVVGSMRVEMRIDMDTSFMFGVGITVINRAEVIARRCGYLPL